MTKPIPLVDLLFFLLESRDDPKHVGALMLFDRPRRAGRTFVADLAADYRKAVAEPPFNLILDTGLTHAPRWKRASALDMAYHVQHLVLRKPGGQRQLLAKIASLHREVLDRSQPCFRLFLIEGLAAGGFAMYFQIHHAMVDGQSAVARIVASLSADPAARKVEPFFAVAMDPSRAAATRGRSAALRALKTLVTRQTLAAKDLYVGLLRTGAERLAGKRSGGSVPFVGPRGPLNARIEKDRSVATLSLPIADMRAVGKAYGGTLNDVAATIVDAGLREYLAALGQPPARPLVAMCPLSLRAAGDTEATTKATVMFVALGDPDMDVVARMRRVIDATKAAKVDLRALPGDAAMLYAMLAFGLGEAASLVGARASLPIANLVLSNVPGPRTQLYLRGARLAAMYPMSALGVGIGLNVTLLSCGESMDFGFVANGAALPDLDRLALATGKAFSALRAAAPARAALPAAAKTPSGRA
ncbi:MAG: wax ester/triacylglycerol synthase family O-acyltransferase [Burkholderiales bacterium]|nr:wax ester/triacylglycerol synthase family O-acyltransferase [Burkholderiales bacterium]